MSNGILNGLKKQKIKLLKEKQRRLRESLRKQEAKAKRVEKILKQKLVIQRLKSKIKLAKSSQLTPEQKARRILFKKRAAKVAIKLLREGSNLFFGKTKRVSSKKKKR